jgi:glutathione S-transferase
VLWLLEELGLDYTVVRYERDPRTMLAPPALKAVHPLGKAPVITDDRGTLAESGAIVEYLASRHGAGRLVPAEGSAERLRYTYWLHYAEASAMPPMLLRLVLGRLARGPMPFFLRPLARRIADGAETGYVGPQVRLHLDHMEAELGRSTWFAGEGFTAADIQMSFPLELAEARGGVGAGRTNLRRFLDRIRARPAHARALERGGPYGLGPRGR